MKKCSAVKMNVAKSMVKNDLQLNDYNCFRIVECKAYLGILFILKMLKMTIKVVKTARNEFRQNNR